MKSVSSGDPRRVITEITDRLQKARRLLESYRPEHEHLPVDSRRPHEAQRGRSRTCSRRFITPARTISQVAPAVEIAAVVWWIVSCSMSVATDQ
jgi:hypothetical protein